MTQPEKRYSWLVLRRAEQLSEVSTVARTWIAYASSAAAAVELVSNREIAQLRPGDALGEFHAVKLKDVTARIELVP